MKKYSLFVVGILLQVNTLTYAKENEEQSLQLWQAYQQKIHQQQQETQFTQSDDDRENKIILDGQSFTVANTEEDVGQALYIAVNQQLWKYVEKFLSQYRRFPQYKKELVWFAEGALARHNGDLESAEIAYRKLLNAEPDFVRGQLDFARILFESKKNKEAKQLFSSLSQASLPEEIKLSLNDYIQILNEREQWQGRLSVGYRYQKNINQSSQHNSCLLFSSGSCLVERSAPKALNASGFGYELTLNRKINLMGHHNINIYFDSEGKYYPTLKSYNDTTFKSYIGYDFQNAQKEIIVAPLFEYEIYGNKRYYNAYGVHLEWTQSISAKHLFNAQFEQKYLYYNDDYSTFKKAKLSSLFTSWYYSPRKDTTIFIGADGSYRAVSDKTNAYKTVGGRLGIYHQFSPQINLTLLASLKKSRYCKYDAVLEAVREDKQLNYQAVLSFPNLNHWNITPNLIVKRTHNRSNVDWLYSYKQTEAQFNLNWTF